MAAKRGVSVEHRILILMLQAMHPMVSDSGRVCECEGEIVKCETRVRDWIFIPWKNHLP